MKKISIVGVEGSGKTVLLSAIGDKYENPDASGVFLSPENERAFGFTTMHMHAMRSGQWPVATTANSNLDWTLFRNTDGRNEEICRLSLLDFAGEAYRLCFGEHSEEETDNWADVLAALKDHIAQSDLLIVIVNLSDVINASPTDPRSRETKWLTKSVIDYATRNGNSKDVAIVFSQADVYKSEIEACGGNEAALRKYLPHVANVYGNLPVLAVSAINKTQPDDITGKAVPAKDFDSEGIDELMEWIISKMPGYADFAQEMAELRLAPIHLWQEARDLWAQYLASLTLSTAERYSIACSLRKKLLELRAASEKSPKNAPAQGDLLPLEEKALAIFDFETKAKEVMSLVTYSSKAAALRRLEEYAQKDQRISMEKQRLEREIDGMFAKLKGEHSASVRTGLITAALLLVGIVGLATAGWFYHVEKEKQLAMEIARQQELEQREQERLRKERELELARQHEVDMREKESQGYEIVIENGKKRAVWTSGRKHPENSSLIADSTPGKWNCTKPGYAWTEGSEIAWKSGLVHPENSNLRSSYSEGEWTCIKPGYVWTGGSSIEWRAGQVSHLYPHWISIDEKEYWRPQEGYRKENPDVKGLGKLIWNPGTISKDGKSKAASQEGKWLTKVDCRDCNGKGEVKRYRDCSKCDGSGKVSGTTECNFCNGEGVREKTRACSICKGWGNRLVDCDAGCQMIRYFAMGTWDTHAGFYCGCGGSIMCHRCHGMGIILCNRCGGTGKVSRECAKYETVSEDCSWCDNGRKSCQVNCSRCDGDRRLSVWEDCSNCENGKVWESE